MGVSPAISGEKAAEVSAGPKRHSPVFLAVFALFLVTTVICVAGTMIGVASAHPSHHDTQWFWASGHLLDHGKNPDDRQAIRDIETSLGLKVGSTIAQAIAWLAWYLYAMTGKTSGQKPVASAGLASA